VKIITSALGISAALFFAVALPAAPALAQDCGVGPAGPITPRGYWHGGRFFDCQPPRAKGARSGGSGCGDGPAGPIPPSGYWHNGMFYGCNQRPRNCGVGPAGPIPPGGYWHSGRFYACGA
jgi:hypothetical protein